MFTSQELHNTILEELLPSAAQVFSANHQAPKGVKMQQRTHSIRISTGKQIAVDSPYYKYRPFDCSEARRPLLEHWQAIDGMSPLLMDRVGFMSMLAPSYELACQSVNKFGVEICLSSVQKITTRLAHHCDELGHENIVVKERETLKDKTVVISLDGGRSRMREYTGLLNTNGQACYDTPWREPKLFVIDILGKDGRVHREELPIYGCRFNEQDVVELLGRYLKKLGIEQAKCVQLIADGAPWIWNRIPPLLVELGVPPDRLTQTLDYYHASQYINDLVKAMPQRLGKNKREQLLNQFTQQLKKGEVADVVTEIKSIIKRKSDLVKRWINYLEKHTGRMQYAHYKLVGLMRGSGIVESAIRRIINLRFKNTSTFWLANNVEKLYFLRGALVAGRWNVVMENIYT